MSLLAGLTSLISDFIASLGYPGLFIMMALESMIAPVPSEAVMPFAGFLVQKGTFDFTLVVIVSTLGSVAGSLSRDGAEAGYLFDLPTAAGTLSGTTLWIK